MNLHELLNLLMDGVKANLAIGIISIIAIALIFLKRWKDIKYLDHGVKHRKMEAMLSLIGKGMEKVHPLELEITVREFLGVQINRELILRLTSVDEPLRNLNDFKDAVGNVTLSSNKTIFESKHFLPLSTRKIGSLLLLPLLCCFTAFIALGTIATLYNGQIDSSFTLLGVVSLFASLTFIWNTLELLRASYAEERLLSKEFPLIDQ